MYTNDEHIVVKTYKLLLACERMYDKEEYKIWLQYTDGMMGKRGGKNWNLCYYNLKENFIKRCTVDKYYKLSWVYKGISNLNWKYQQEGNISSCLMDT